MPTYEYECLLCQYKFEVFHTMSDDSPKKCPTCKEGFGKKLISAGAAGIVKGTETPCRGKR